MTEQQREKRVKERDNALYGDGNVLLINERIELFSQPCKTALNCNYVVFRGVNVAVAVVVVIADK